MDNTFIALFRKIEDSFVYQDSELLHLWIHCLIKASYKDRTIMFDGVEVALKRGQFITGRKSLAKALNSTEQKIRSRLALLEKHNKISQKSTNKYSIITVVKYSYYQYDEKKITSREPADNQQITTNNKDNKDNNNISEPNGSAQSDLPTNNKDMAWNTTSDDFADDISIDLDGDGTLEEKKPQTRKYPNAPAVRKIFQEVLGKSPAAWKQNKNQLLACENLYTERGLDKVKSALLFYKEHQQEEYCPKIHSPHCLDSKWTKLGEYKLSL